MLVYQTYCVILVGKLQEYTVIPLINSFIFLAINSAFYSKTYENIKFQLTYFL